MIILFIFVGEIVKKVDMVKRKGLGCEAEARQATTTLRYLLRNQG